MVKIVWSSSCIVTVALSEILSLLNLCLSSYSVELSAQLDAHDRRTTDFMCVENQTEA